LDIKDDGVYDINPSDDHVSLDTIVCHPFACDPNDDVSTYFSDSIPYFDSQLSNFWY
jgi:hypothetical protein